MKLTSAEAVKWLRTLARNYADGVAGMEPQDHRAWEIADKIAQLREAWEHSNLILRELRRSREWLQADNKRLRALIRDAYQEGYKTAGGMAEWKIWWGDSEARRALGQK